MPIERVTTPAALAGVLDIEEASFNNPTSREWYERELARPEVCFIYVLRTAEHPCAAFCAFWLIADQAHINNLAVRPEFRGRGLGIQMLAAVVAEAERLGAGSIGLEVRQSNVAAQRLYKKAGFREHGIRKSYYTQPVEDALLLIKTLQNSQLRG
ncbi:MAG TPA: ribosomal protein S18-alanine N-acetyltransferase [Nitrobacter sp.]|nr:ribosomal protein S18-alanine N-acetyltransferase [Nitrobacter sp.]